MKKTIAIIMVLALMLSTTSFLAFADDEESAKVYGPNEPRIEDLENCVLDDTDFATPIFRDNPEFEIEGSLGREAEDYGFSPYFTTIIRLKMDADIHVELQSEFSGNLYAGIWKADNNNESHAVEVKSAAGSSDGQRQFDLSGLQNNKVYMLVVALCGDTSEDEIKVANVRLTLTATAQGEGERCTHIPWKVDKETAVCGYDGYKAHWECMDCGTWLVKNKASGDFRTMKKSEKKKLVLKMPARKHNFTEKKRNKSTLCHKADCTHAAEYYYTCKNCGITSSKTFKVGKALGHNYKKGFVIPATYEKAGKIGTICSRCKKAKKNTKVTVIPKIEEALLLAEPWYVGPNATPKFTVTVNGKKIKTKYFEVSLEPGEYNEDGSRMVLATAKLKGNYDASACCFYFQFNHEPTEEEKADLEELFRQLEELTKL